MPTRNTEDVVKPNPRIPRKIYDQLKKVAEAERHSINDEIVIAVEEHVKRKRGEDDRR